MTLLLATTLALIFLIVALLLRSPVAGVVVVGTVALSYASALGASVLIWQHLLGHDLHWSVAPISFIALVAVGADYNLLLAMRIREEADAGLSTGIIRAFAATGGVVTTAGIVFGITMFALAGSSVLSIAQIGCDHRRRLAARHHDRAYLRAAVADRAAGPLVLVADSVAF